MCLAIPGLVEARHDGLGGLLFATVAFGAVRREVCLAYTPDVQAGDYVIVHVGFAIQRLDAGQAAETLALLDAGTSVDSACDETGASVATESTRSVSP